MIPFVLRNTVGRRRFKRGISRASWYEKDFSREEAESFQIERFNKVWSKALRDIPFYRSWSKEHSLPEQISSIAQLQQFPALTKATIVERQDQIFTDTQGNGISNAYSTGGTTGTPTRYPKGDGESDIGYANSYTTRGWWGIRPFDSYVHVWGHSHLFGKGRLAKFKRQFQDALVNSTRVNAYDMSESALDSHAKTIIRRNPTYVVGYTSAIFKIARHIQAHGLDTSGLTRMRAIIVTAETVTRADVDVISKVFGAPVAIEYGAAETGVMAHSRGTSWPLQVLWRSYIVNVDNESRMLVTTLEDRLFPLINYSIGDTVEGGDIVGGNALTLGAVTGRTQDVVTVSTVNGGHLELSAILPVHILKTLPGVMSVQYRQEESGQLKVFLTASCELNLESVSDTFTVELKRDHADFDASSVLFRQVSVPLLTKAGKQALFI